MSDLGQQLKEARMQKGLSLEDVQEMTKIRKRYLEAIEQGDFKVLPGSFYVRAFIKTYAEAVDLDAEALLQNHPKDVPAAEPESVMEPVLTKRSARTSAPARSGGGGGRGEGSKGLSTALMWTFPILILIIVAIVYVNSTKSNTENADPATGEDTTATTQQPTTDNAGTSGTDSTGGGAQTPDATAPSGSETTTDETGTEGTDATGTGTTGTEGTGTEGEDPSGQTGTDPSTDPTGETGTEETGATPNTSGSTVVTPAGQEGKTTVFTAQPTQGGSVKVTINASGMSWLEVYRGSTSGEKLYYQNTQEGEALSFDLDAQGLYIKSGYSPATDIRIDGQPITDGKTTSRFKINLVN